MRLDLEKLIAKPATAIELQLAVALRRYLQCVEAIKRELAHDHPQVPACQCVVCIAIRKAEHGDD